MEAQLDGEGLDEVASPLAANQTMGSAAYLAMGGTASGFFDDESESGWWKFTMPATGRVDFSGRCGCDVSFLLYDSSGNKLEGWNCSYDDVVGSALIDHSSWVTKGTYYVCAKRTYSWKTGSFSFGISYENANVSFSAEHGSLTNYNTIYVGNSYNGVVALNDDTTFYQISLPSAGRLSFAAALYFDSRVYLYDADGKVVWSESDYTNDVTGRVDISEQIDLTSGTYYIAVTRYWDEYGRYTFSTSFSSAGESFTEVQNGSNNTIDEAEEASGNKTYKGQIALNDDKDFYKFQATGPGTVTVQGTSYTSIHVHAYDKQMEEVVDETFYVDSDTGRVNFKVTFDVAKGAFWVCFERYFSSTGSYSFSVNGPVGTSSTPSSKLPAPSSVSASPVSPKGVRVTWSRVSGADGYVIMRAPYGSSSYSKVGSVNSGYTLYFVDSSAAPGSSYYYSVIAFVKSGSSYARGNWSYRQSVRTAPAAPKITSVSASSSGVRVTWSKVSGADGYIVMRCDGTSGNYVKIATYGSGASVSALDTTAVAGRTYSYSVIAFINRGGEYTRGAWAMKRTVTAGASSVGTKLPAPSSVSASPVSPKGVRVTWSRVSGADGYVIMRAPYGSSSYSKVGSVNSGYTLYFVDSSAAPGSSYYYSVIAFVKSGSSYARGNWSYRQSVRTAPAAPKITSVSASSSGVRVTWSKVSGADGYIVMRCDGTSGNYVKIATYGSGASVSALDTTAVAGRTYSYSVIAFINRGGEYTRGAWAMKRTVTAG